MEIKNVHVLSAYQKLAHEKEITPNYRGLAYKRADGIPFAILLDDYLRAQKKRIEKIRLA